MNQDAGRGDTPSYLLPPIKTLLLIPLISSSALPPSAWPPESVLHRFLLNRRFPLSKDEEEEGEGREMPVVTFPLGQSSSSSSSSEGLSYNVRVHRAWQYDPAAECPSSKATIIHGLVTQSTRILVQGQSCQWLSPHPTSWASFFGEGSGSLPTDSAALEEICLRLRVGLGGSQQSETHTQSSSGSSSSLLLVEGPPGAGKTALVGAAARKLGLYTIVVRPGSLMATHDVEADAALEKAVVAASLLGPALLLIDDVDLLVPSTGGGGGRAQRQMAASKGEVDRALEQWISELEERGCLKEGVLLVMTSRPGWRRGSLRADRRMSVAAGDEAVATRAQVLAQYIGGGGGEDENILPPPDKSLLEHVARRSQGFSLGEIVALARRAFFKMSNKTNNNNNNNTYTWGKALEQALAEGRAGQLSRGAGLPPVLKVDPPVLWQDVGGMEAAKKAVQEMITWPMARPKAFARLGIKPATGLLLYGPPGTGKTMVAKAAACQSGAGFLSIRIPDIVRGEIGRAEVLLRDAFRAAVKSRPVIIFIDEFQALFTARGGGGGGGEGSCGSSTGGRLASQLLQSMDELRQEEEEEATNGEEGGTAEKGYVSVLAATNAPEAIDPAFLRPGRFDRLVYAALPTKKDRVEILEGLRARMQWSSDLEVGVERLAAETEGFSGADLANLFRRAALHALAAQQQQQQQQKYEQKEGKQAPPATPPPPPSARVAPPKITRKDVEQALASCKPSTSTEALATFADFQQRHKGM